MTDDSGSLGASAGQTGLSSATGPASGSGPSGFDPSRDYRGVCYRPGKPTVADYNEAIESLLAAKHQLQSGDLMGCDVCGDSGHASQDGCHHDPLVLARQWAAATAVYECYHCGFIATTDAEARQHFGRNEFERSACDSDGSLAEDAQRLSPEGVPARAANSGIAQPTSEIPHDS